MTSSEQLLYAANIKSTLSNVAFKHQTLAGLKILVSCHPLVLFLLLVANKPCLLHFVSVC